MYFIYIERHTCNDNKVRELATVLAVAALDKSLGMV